jgi:catechol 2,3-dioxygenase-like lactoylglutathione lyase family enzyme
MILGVDHVAFETLDFEGTIRRFERLGFAAAFIERKLPNPEEKRSFLAGEAAAHSIALMRKPGSVAVEVTHHCGREASSGSTTSARTSWAHAAASRKAGDVARPIMLAHAPRRRRGERSRIGATAPSASNRESEFRLRTIAISTSNWQGTRRFWRDGLGWTVASEVEEGSPPIGCGSPPVGATALLERKSLIDEWSLSVVVRLDLSRRRRTSLDEPGWTCAAMVSSDVEGDLLRLADCGASESTPPFEFAAGGRRLRIALVRGPAGEIVELIELS